MTLRMVSSREDLKEVGDCAYEVRTACYCRKRCYNCDGPGHLIIVMPSGEHWDSDGRAGNCGSKADDDHRCWVKSGNLENLTLSKDGLTCQGGAGSIQIYGGTKIPPWHGFLRNGEFVAS